MAYNHEIPFTQELLRKGIHLISLSIPIGYIFTSKTLALSILVPLTLLFIIMDLLGKKDNGVRKFINRFFGKMLRPHEVEDKLVLNGASWVMISAVITIFVFPKTLAVTSFSILIISDICAAIFGRKFGKHKIYNKSWEGTFAFIISAFCVVTILGFFYRAPISYFLSGFVAAFIGGFVEATSGIIKIDDNIAVPMVVGLVMWLGGIIAYGNNMPFF